MNVDQLLKGIDPRLRTVSQSLRTGIKKSIPEAVEQVKWGNPIYRVKGKNTICIMIYGDHVNLGFFMGSQLKSKKFEGTGKGLRHIKVRSKSDIDAKEFGRLL